ncbi:MAG: insulinase family protein [Candidatus Yanofskybacteria bacterium]|nr:insulinase family protein [Candidatus Yanofskybacteria bacterium]
MTKGFDYKFNTLDSGLRVITIPMDGTKTVTVLVLVGTGSKYESREINGISHFLEHMMFKGTTKRPGYLDISRELDSIGASYNAFTGKEYTGYYAKASAEKLDTVMDVIFDIFLNSKIDEKALNTERGVIIEEINMRQDINQEHVGKLFEQLLYGDQPAGWDISGPKENILNMKREDFVEYFNTHYIAQNTVIAITGGIKSEDVLKKTEVYMQKIRTGTPVTKLPTKESQDKPQVVTFYKKTDQTHFVLGVRTYPLFDRRKYALSVLGTVLGGGMSSRLFDEIREKRGLAYYVSAGNQAYTDSGYFEVSAGVNNEKVKEAISVVLQELKKIRDQGIDAGELRRAIDQIIGRTSLALEHSDNVAEAYADPILFENKVLTPEEELDKIKKVTLTDIMEVASDIFQNNKLNLALIGPFEDKKPFEELLKLD